MSAEYFDRTPNANRKYAVSLARQATSVQNKNRRTLTVNLGDDADTTGAACGHDLEAATSRLSEKFSYQGHYSSENSGENHRPKDRCLPVYHLPRSCGLNKRCSRSCSPPGGYLTYRTARFKAVRIAETDSFARTMGPPPSTAHPNSAARRRPRAAGTGPGCSWPRC